jgi:hypothetical protein
VPYPFAHPAAVLPLAALMGRFAVPSALAIGSVAPDFWHIAPFATRTGTHSLGGLFWFCLPAGLLAYALFHLALKEPLIALLSPRLAGFACRGLPAAPAGAVIASLLAGALTHIAWDYLTHPDGYVGSGHNWPQHISTALGTLVLGGWLVYKLRRAPRAARPGLTLTARIRTWLALLAAAGVAAWWSSLAEPVSLDGLSAVRHLLRSAGIAGAEGLWMAILTYCLVWQWRHKRTTSA